MDPLPVVTHGRVPMPLRNSNCARRSTSSSRLESVRLRKGYRGASRQSYRGDRVRVWSSNTGWIRSCGRLLLLRDTYQMKMKSNPRVEATAQSVLASLALLWVPSLRSAAAHAQRYTAQATC